MAETEVTEPLLPAREGLLSYVGTTLRRPVFWWKAADVLAVGVCTLGFIASLFLLCDNEGSTSPVCRPRNLTFFHGVMVMFPAFAAMMVTLLSETVRVWIGGGPSRVCSVLEYMLGALVGGWIQACAGGVLGWMGLSVAVVLLSVAVTFCFYGHDDQDSA
jgi:hypothetical protein